jgi:acetolactate synthase I/II/III large subunit
MTTPTNTRTGGQVLADALRIHGCDTAFCVAGESYLALLDALHDHKDFNLYTTRHEGGAANMAEAYAKVTGKPGLVMVTRGPGACHGSIGLHTAYQDSTPMIMLIGQVARDQFDREAFQEIDYRQMFGQVTKWVAQIEDAERIPEYIARAFHVAMSGRPGPVALALPEDMLRDRVAVNDTAPYAVHRAYPSPDAMQKLRGLMGEAKKPLLLVGGGGWGQSAVDDIRSFAEANNLPMMASFRCLDLIDHSSDLFAGDLSTSTNPKLAQAVRDCDLLICAGARLGEITTQGYELISPPNPPMKLVHIHGSAEELGSVYQPTLGIQAGPEGFAAAAAAMEPVNHSAWDGWTAQRRADFLEWATPRAYGTDLDLGACMQMVQERMEPDSIVTVDAGNFSGWPMRFLRFQQRFTFAAPTSGAMGYSVPAAVGASLAHPGRRVFAFVGDGGFLMTGQELATALQYGATPIILVFNNGMYGTIRMHQARHHPGRYIATDLHNPDFVALMNAYGGHSELVETTADFGPALDRALASGKAALIEIRQDPDVISTTTTLSKMEAAARAE